MIRRGASNKGLLVCLTALLVLGGAAVVYRFMPSSGGNAGPGKDNPGVADKTPPPDVPGPPITATAKVTPRETIEVPFIFWGGDVGTFVANGGLETKKDSIFAHHDLNIKLTPGDDFDAQVKNYLAGKTPFLRGTLSMLGQASEQLTAKPETVPVVFLQLTWSGGDHFVGRAGFKTLNDLKGKKIALQKGGPHVGMLNDILRTARLKWEDINVVWTEDVSGDKGPPALFRKDGTIDACFAISPDMSDLTGGLEATGNGQKNTIKGAHVVVSTAQMSHSIADVYACRRDFWEGNKEWVQAFAAGYLKGCEDLVDAKKRGAGGEAGPGARYKDAIHLAQQVWGKDPAFKDSVAKDDDVDGLISDATFVGLPGNIAFFTAKGNLTGFQFKESQALQLPDDPATQPFKSDPKRFQRADFDYEAVRKTGGLNGKAITQNRFSPEIKIEPEKTIYSFNIYFAHDSYEFPEAQYGEDFQRALEEASLFGNAVVAIRGHATPIALIERFLIAAEQAGLIKENDGSYTLKDGKPLDLNNIQNVLDVIDANPNLTHTEDGQSLKLKDAVQQLQELSNQRAEAVRKSVVSHAQSKGLVLEQSQIRSQGVGVREPVIPYPMTEEESAKNRRVEFSIIKVPADQVTTDEFGL